MIFFDTSLSTPGGTSCASCHDPRRAFAGNNGSTIGVAAGSRPRHFARRNTPSVLYMRYVPSFHYALEDDDDVNPASPFGGLTWSGQGDSAAEFSRLPLLDPRRDEQRGRGRDRDQAAGGALAGRPPWRPSSRTPSTRRRLAVRALGDALQAFLTSDAMTPFSSRYDAFLRGETKLSELEMRGLAAFKSPEKGACSGCHHLYDRSTRSDRSMFTDYGYDAVAVPRNQDIPANADAARYDIGLCERKQTQVPSSDPKWCASFRTPSLRNVAVRDRSFNGELLRSLREVVVVLRDPGATAVALVSGGHEIRRRTRQVQENVNVTSLRTTARRRQVPARRRRHRREQLGPRVMCVGAMASLIHGINFSVILSSVGPTASAFRRARRDGRDVPDCPGGARLRARRRRAPRAAPAGLSSRNGTRAR